jgi:hypothetical protein
VVTSIPNSFPCQLHSESGVSLLIFVSRPARISFTATSSSTRRSSSWLIAVSCCSTGGSALIFALWPCCRNAVRLSASPGGGRFQLSDQRGQGIANRWVNPPLMQQMPG